MIRGLQNRLITQVKKERFKMMDEWVRFAKKNKHHLPIDEKELRKRLKNEGKRICDFGGDGIIIDRFHRAGYYFLGVLFITAISPIFSYFFTPNVNPAVLATPIASACAASLMLILTAKGSLMKRYRGGMKATTKAYLRELKEKARKKNELVNEVKLECSHAVIQSELTRQNSHEEKNQLLSVTINVPDPPRAEIKYIPPVPPIYMAPANDNDQPPPPRLKSFSSR